MVLLWYVNEITKKECISLLTGCLQCAGPSVTVSAPPLFTVQMAASANTVNIGQYTSTQMYDGMKSALSELCPTTASSCHGGTVTIPGIQYYQTGIGQPQILSNGELEIYVEDSSFTEPSILESLFQKVASAAGMSHANGGNCRNVTGDNCTEEIHGECPRLEDYALCNMFDFVSASFFDGAHFDTISDYINVKIDFTTVVDELGLFLCELVVDAALDAAFEEFEEIDPLLIADIPILAEFICTGGQNLTALIDNSQLINGPSG